MHCRHRLEDLEHIRIPFKGREGSQKCIIIPGVGKGSNGIEVEDWEGEQLVGEIVLKSKFMI